MNVRNEVYDALKAILTKSGQTLMPKTAVDRIIKQKPNLTRLNVRQGLSALAKEELLFGVRPDGFIVGKLGWMVQPVIEVSPELAQWRIILEHNKKSLTQEQYDALYNGNKVILELSAEQQRTLLTGLIKLSRDQSENDPYLLSAKYLLGSSKAFDKLGKKITSHFRPETDLSSRVQYVLTAGPEAPKEPEAIIIIENMSNFTAFQSSPEVQKALAICSFGYGISTDRIGERLLDGSLSPCPAVGPKPDLEHLFKTVPCYFWGDLDKAGLDIYLSLKNALPELKISAAYEVMAEKLQGSNTCHSYDALSDKKGQKSPRKTSDENVLFLASLCEEKAVDQEAICCPWPGQQIFQEFDLNRLKTNDYSQ